MRFYELFIGRRYVRSTRGNRFISFISITSMVGIAIGVAVLIIVLSVMNGYERELRQRILSVTAHATISAFNGGLPDWPALREKAAANSQVVAAAPYVEGQAMIIAGHDVSAVMVEGVAPAEERKVSSIGDHMKAGSMDALQSGGYGVVLGDELAKALNVKLGDRVLLVIAKANVSAIGVLPAMRRFTVQGIFSVGMYEYDRNLAFIQLNDAARLYRMEDEVTGLRLRLVDLFEAPKVVRELATQLGGGFYVDDWTRRHANLFAAVQLTKSLMFVILLLVVAVAAFNIVSTLVMVVKDKQSDIAILRTLGARPRSVLAVFFTQGTAIGLIGTLAGLALGVLISVNLESLIHGLEYILGTHFLDAKVYFMSDLPATVQWQDVLQICGTAFGLCCLSTLYPAWRGARVEPAQALRHD
jgi:lipoprotein-releasing system permease protein